MRKGVRYQRKVLLKSLISEVVSLGEKTVGVKVFFTGGCKVFAIKDEVGSVNNFEGKHRSDIWHFVYAFGVRREQGLKM